ncbi:MAG: translation initiation factor IF-2 [DPANN group archaeon]|nr:translation initiation factor IF-2 [DPANN group archaeon]
MSKIRQPIIAILAHVDHGKTTLLDYIRGTNVAGGEAGGITQHIGATEIPIKNIKAICSNLFEKWNMDVTFPGLLFIDTPGHAVFTPLRERGGSLADIAIVVIDITEGFRPQTDEVITILKKSKTPFIVAANKIDKLSGWQKNKGMCFLESYGKQRDDVKEHLDMKIYELIGQFFDRGFQVDRFDRVEDFTKQICVVPISAQNGEGMSELLTILSGVTQKYLGKTLEIDEDGPGRGTILEVKEIKGLGMTIDVILYDGLIRRNDVLVIGHPSGAIKTKVKAILKPEPMRDIRVEKQFKQLDEVHAASGFKISATGLDDVIPGVPIVAMRVEKDIEAVKKEVNETIDTIRFETESEGVVIKADTIGGLEAMVTLLKEKGIPIKLANIGPVTKKDVVSVRAVDEKYKIIFAFNVEVLADATVEIDYSGVNLFSNRVIYRLIEDYDEYEKQLEEKKKREVIAAVTRPAHLVQAQGFVFRQSGPAICGFDILGGLLKDGVKLMKRDGTVVGRVKQIQSKGVNVKEVKMGERVAVSVDGAVMGRNLKEGDEVFTVLNQSDYKKLIENKELMSGDEINTLELIREIMVKKDRHWDFV